MSADDLKNEISSLKGQINDKYPYYNEKGRKHEGCQKSRGLSDKLHRKLKGHFGKVYALHWAECGGADGMDGSSALVSASQDGKLIIWNAYSTNKTHAIPLRSSWVMTCAFEPTQGNLVACGGLDNLCSVYRVDGDFQHSSNPADKELVAHDGYLSCCRFIDTSSIVTSSGDSTCILWDIESLQAKTRFNDHTGDVMSVSICPNNSNVFCSGSCDASVKVWDSRIEVDNACVMTFGEKRMHDEELCPPHQSDINSVYFLSDGQSIATGSDDYMCALFDMRSYGCISNYHKDSILGGVTSVCASKTGRFIFAGYDDYNLRMWDTTEADQYETKQFHENRVSSVGMSPSGKAICTGSWDTLLHVLTPRQ